MACGPERASVAGPSSTVQRRWPLVVVLAWATALFWPTLFGNQALFWHDASIQNVPLRKCLREAVAAGALPVWSWTYGGGYPVGCDVQSGLAYPLQLFDITGLVTPERGFAVSAWLHFVLAGMGMWALLGWHGMSEASRLLGAIGYMGSGFLAGHVMHVHVVWAAAWLPWLLVALSWLWHKPTVARAALAGAPLGMMLLAGHPQIPFYAFCACVLWALVSPVPPAARRSHLAAWTVLAVAFGGWLGLGPYWASRDLFAASVRAARGAGYHVFDMALDPRYWPLILHPFLYGSYAENNYFGGAHHYEVCGYLAAPVLVLGVLGLTAARPEHRRLAATLAVLAVAAFFMAAARQNPIYYLLGRWPPLGSFRAHARWLVLVGASWSGLAGIGAETLLGAASRRRTAVVGAVTLAVWAGTPVLARVGQPLVVAVLAAQKADSEAAEQKAADKYAQMLRRVSWQDPYWVGFGLTGAALLAAGTAGLARAALGLCLATAAVEGGLYAHSYLPTVPVEYYRTPPKTARIILCDPGPVYVDPACREHERPPASYRGWARDGTWYYMAEREAMRPNRSALWGVTGARCEMQFALASQVRTMSELVPALLADPRTRAAGYRLLASLGVKWAIVPHDRRPTGSRLAEKTLYSGLYRVPGAQAPVRACTGEPVMVGPDDLEPADVQRLPSSESALVAGIAGLPPGDGEVRQVVAQADGSLALVAECRRPTLVLLGVPLYRAHRATVDGRAAGLVKVNGYCAGVVLPAGRHRVRLYYDTTGLWQAGVLYASAWAALLAALLVLLRRPTR